ncbi:MAG: hypothetical protein AMXMBFR44_0540 [Candidatus Campbellbacteria bacterium]
MVPQKVSVTVRGEVFTVNVNWNADNGKWNVNAYRLDDNRWYRGYRAFPSNYEDSSALSRGSFAFHTSSPSTEHSPDF